jgi:hypothetical protein
MNLVTLGRSDAILVCEVLKLALQDKMVDAPFDREEAEDLLQFVEVQLNSIAENDIRSPLSHIWRPM